MRRWILAALCLVIADMAVATDNPDINKVFLLTATPYDPGTAAEVTVRLSDKGYTTTPSDSPANALYPPRLTNPYNFETSLFRGGRALGNASASFGAMKIANDDGEMDHLAGYYWQGRPFTLMVGEKGAAFSTFSTMFSGRVDDIEWDDRTITLRIRDPRTKLDKDIQTSLYAGTGGYEGGSDLEGRPRPLLFGKTREAAPTLVDDARLIYDAHDGSMEAIDAVYDAGLPLQADGDLADYPSFSDLTDSDLPAVPLDGTRLYVGWHNFATGGIVTEYTVNNRWQVNTSFFETTSFDLAGSEAVSESPTDIYIGRDGTRFYVADTNDQEVHQFTLNRAWDLRSAVYEKSYSPSSNALRAVSFKPDGTKMFVIDTVDGTDMVLKQYSLSTAWDVGTASKDAAEYDIPAVGDGANDFAFKDDGTKLYVVNQTTVSQHSLSTGWDVSTASDDSVTLDVSGEDSVTRGLALGDGGEKLYTVGSSSDNINQYSLSTAWDLSTATFDSVTFNLLPDDTTPAGLHFRDDGGQFFFIGASTEYAFSHDLETAWDVSTATNPAKDTGGDISGAIRDLFIRDDGDKLYVLDSDSKVYQYALSTSWDISTASFESKTLDASSEDGAVAGLAFSDDGTKAYIVGQENDAVFEYDLGTAWDISTASYSGNSLDVSEQDSFMSGIAFGDGGSALFLSGTGSVKLFQYDLSTAWDVSTAAYDGKSLDVSPDVTKVVGLFIDPEGDRAYIFDHTESNVDAVLQYRLDTAWDIESGNFALRYTLPSESADPGIAVNPQGLFFRTTGNDGGPLTRGGFLTDLANGRYRLGATPAGQVTHAARGDNTGGYVDSASEIVERIVRNAGLTNDDIDQASFDQVVTDNGATTGIFVPSERARIPGVIDAVLSTVGGWRTFNRAGEMTIGVLKVPGTSIETLTEADVHSIKRRSAGRPVHKIRLGYDRTWTVQPEGSLAASLSAEEKRLRSNGYRYVTAEDATIESEHELSEIEERDTLFDAKSDAQTEVDRLIDLIGPLRDVYEINIGWRILDFDLNDTVTLDLRVKDEDGNVVGRRLGFPKDFRVIGYTENARRNEATLQLWG